MIAAAEAKSDCRNIIFDSITVDVSQVHCALSTRLADLAASLRAQLASNYGTLLMALLQRFDELHVKLHETPATTVELDAMCKFVAAAEAEEETLKERLQSCKDTYGLLVEEGIPLQDQVVADFWRAVAAVPRLQVRSFIRRACASALGCTVRRGKVCHLRLKPISTALQADIEGAQTIVATARHHRIAELRADVADLGCSIEQLDVDIKEFVLLGDISKTDDRGLAALHLEERLAECVPLALMPPKTFSVCE